MRRRYTVVWLKLATALLSSPVLTTPSARFRPVERSEACSCAPAWSANRMSVPHRSQPGRAEQSSRRQAALRMPPLRWASPASTVLHDWSALPPGLIVGTTGFSTLERLKALVAKLATFQLADAVPEPDPAAGGRPRKYPVFMWLLFDVLLSVYGSGRSRTRWPPRDTKADARALSGCGR